MKANSAKTFLIVFWLPSNMALELPESIYLEYMHVTHRGSFTSMCALGRRQNVSSVYFVCVSVEEEGD